MTPLPRIVVDRGHVQPGYAHYDDLDLMGFVHNCRYPVMVERALTGFWSENGFTYTDGKYSQPDIFLAVAEFSVRYLAPIRGTVPYAVHFWISKLAESSAVYEFRVLSEDGTTVHAEGRRVHIRIDQETLRPTPWTPAFHEVAEKLL
ncbi:acyl-CoA thioesterase [Kitasatospora sp. NPDC056076]|uniref:acyl-CoA thioesterase n=1 Tax=unclassified Kitasatospora TaxID=2633591 RepID=UPI0035DA09A5